MAMQTHNIPSPSKNGISEAAKTAERRTRPHATKEFRAIVKDEWRILLLRGTKTKWVRGLRYLYMELLKAYFGKTHDPDVTTHFADLFLGVMEAYFAEEKRPLRRYLPALTFLLWQSHGMPSEAARIEWVFERIDWGLDAIFAESELTRRVLRLAAVVSEPNTPPPTWLKDWAFYTQVQKLGWVPKAKPSIGLTFAALLTANYPLDDWAKFFAIEAGRPDPLLEREGMAPILKKPKPQKP